MKYCPDHEKRFLCILLFCFFFVLLVAQDLEDEQSEDAESQKDMCSFMQWSSKIRFGSDLQVGDHLEYKMYRDTLAYITIDVQADTSQALWIVERFDNLELHELIDRKDGTLMKYYGYDEDGSLVNVDLLPEDQVQERTRKMEALATSMFVAPDSISAIRNTKTIRGDFGQLSCSVLEPQYTTRAQSTFKGKTPDTSDDTRQYFCEQVPKMIPVLAIVPNVLFANMYKEIPEGLVKCSGFELMSYRKGKEN
jgi:hypothetical protein